MHKLFLLIHCFAALHCIAQNTIHSIKDGYFSDTLTWGCNCIPEMGDQIFIDHKITLDSNLAMNGNGKIIVSAGSSFIQDSWRTLIMNGIGTKLVNDGKIILQRIYLSPNNTVGSNSGELEITGSFFSGSDFINSGVIKVADSMVANRTFNNVAYINAKIFFNPGSFRTIDGVTCQSLINTGVFELEDGYVFANYFKNGIHADFLAGQPPGGFLNISGNAINQGNFKIFSSSDVTVGGNFYTGDPSNNGAVLTNQGLMIVAGDFECEGTMNGDGNFCVGGYTVNSGYISGTMDFCDNSGNGGFDLNEGTISGSVTFCSPGCYLLQNESSEANVQFSPNPSNGRIDITSSGNFNELIVTSLTGNILVIEKLTGNVADLSRLPAGMYFITLRNDEHISQPVPLILE